MTTRMRTSLDEYFALGADKPYLEFIDGEVIQKPLVGKRHSRMVAELIIELGTYLRQTGEASVDTELRHLRREDDWVFLPDISITLRTHPQPVPAETLDPVEVMPDFAIEVLSPDDQPGRVTQRIAHYMRAGIPLLWVIDPEGERVTVWRPGEAPSDLAAPAIVTGAPVLPSFELDLSTLFNRLHN